MDFTYNSVMLRRNIVKTINNIYNNVISRFCIKVQTTSHTAEQCILTIRVLYFASITVTTLLPWGILGRPTHLLILKSGVVWGAPDSGGSSRVTLIEHTVY